MTTDDRDDGETGIWQEDWGAQAAERTEHLAAPGADQPAVTLQARSLPSRLAAGGRFATPLARTIAHQPTSVLRSVATSADAKPLLTVQSPTPSRALARGTAPEAAPVEEPASEPVVDEPAYLAPPLAPRPPTAGSSGGLFAGATNFVLRLFRRPTDPDPDLEPEPDPRPSVPSPQAASTAPAPIARTPEAPSRAPDTTLESASREAATPPGSSQVTIEEPTPLFAATEELPEEPLQSPTPTLQADTTPLVLRSTAVEAQSQIQRPAGDTVESPTAHAEPVPPTQDLQAVAQVEQAIEAPAVQAATETPAASGMPAQVTSVEPAIEPASSPSPVLATPAVSRHEAQAQAEPALEEPALARSQAVPALDVPALARSQDETAVPATIDAYDEPAREPAAPASEPGGLGGLFLTLRRLVSRESRDETDEPAYAEAPAAHIESPVLASTAQIARSVEEPQETPELTTTAAPVLASEAIEAPTPSSIEPTESDPAATQPFDLHAESAVEDAETPAYETSIEAQTGAYTRFALLRARASGESLPESADAEPLALEADSLQLEADSRPEEEPAALEEPASAYAAFIDAPSDPLALRSIARSVDQPSRTAEAAADAPVTIARAPGDTPHIESSRPLVASSTEYAAPTIQRTPSEALTREPSAPAMHLQVARTAVTRAIEREALASGAPDAAPSFVSAPSDSTAFARTPAPSTSPSERATSEYAAPRAESGFEHPAFASMDSPERRSLALASTAAPTFSVARSMSPLVYRQVQRTPEGVPAEAPSMTASAMAQLEYAGDPLAAANAVLRMAEAGSSATQTFSAPAAMIQRLGGEGGGEVPAAPAMSAPGGATPATSSAEAPAAGAGGPLEDPAKAPNAVLDKLAREIYERLRRRLMMERERAGYGTAYS